MTEEKRKIYRERLRELEKTDFREIIGDNLSQYIECFTSVVEKRSFLKYLHDELSERVLIDPNTVEDGSCYLSRFGNYIEIRQLILADIPLKLINLTTHRKTKKEKSFSFRLKEKYSAKEDLIDILYTSLSQHNVVKRELTSLKKFKDVFLSENIYNCTSKVHFGVGPSELIYAIKYVLGKYFKEVPLEDLQRSGCFFDFKEKSLKANNLSKALSTSKGHKSEELVSELLSSIEQNW